MTKKINVLVFPCGSENGSEIFQALRYSLHVELYGASSVEDHGRFRFENYFGGLPNIKDISFDGAFQEIIKQNNIDVVFATHDSVIEYLAEKQDEMGFFLVNGDSFSTKVARSKKMTYDLFFDQAWCPIVYPEIDHVSRWPIIVKPDFGQGAQGISLAHDPSEAALGASKIESAVFVEYLPGQEITVDCFSDRSRNLVWVGPRTRQRVKAGISMRSQPISLTSEIDSIARIINSRLVLRGPWFFQLKLDIHNNWKLLEISCRVAGSMVCQRAMGVNLPLMAIHDFMGRDLVVNPTIGISLFDRNISTKAQLDFEFENVFVDLDDTLIIDGFAEGAIVAFIYQSIKLGKKIILITRHRFDVAKSLKNARISLELFDEIINVPDGVLKSEYVSQNSIFIDNHFPERLDVARNCGIPVFDVDTIEFLLR